MKTLQAGGGKTGSFLLLVMLALGAASVQRTGAAAFITNSPMASQRYVHSATLLTNGCVLVVGGYANSFNGFLNSAELFNPTTGTWSSAGTLPPVGTYPNAHAAHTSTLLTNGTVLVTGGMDSVNIFSQTELFSPASMSWAKTGGMNIARSFHTATLLTNGMVLVAGGFGCCSSTNAALASAELYNPASGTWAFTGVMTTTRKYHTAALLTNGMVMVAGGTDRFGNILSSAELYNPATGTWTATGTMTQPRESHTATLLTNGQVLIVGGSAAVTNAELFNPATGNWTATAAPNFYHYHHTATLLTNGQVLIVGGNLANGTAELYNPGNNTWVMSASLNTNRCFHTATLLPNGQALITGGAATVFGPNSGGPSGYSSTEIYDVSSKASAAVAMTNLIQTFDGSAKGVSVATTPANLTVSVIYNGSANAPTNVGSYTVIGTINDPNYQGAATNTLAIILPAINTQTSISNGVFNLFFTNVSGVSFSVLETTNLSIPISDWNMVGAAMEIMPGQYQFSDPQMTNTGQSFYRLRSP